jgi:hypothetical protein
MDNGREVVETKGPKREWIKNPITRETITKKFWHQVEFSKTIKEKNA